MSESETDTSSDDEREKISKVRKDQDESSSDSACEEDVPGTQEQQKRRQETLEHKESEEDKMSQHASLAPPPPPKPRRKRFIPKYEVEGVYKVILGEEAQLQIDMVIGNHVSAQFPWKFVEKVKILENLENLGDQSEFHKITQDIKEYPEDFILMGFIPDESKDYDEFYVCCTIEAKEHCKQQSDKFVRRQEKKLEKSVNKKPRPWTCLGSDIEIISLQPVNSRQLMEIEIKSPFPRPYQPKKLTVRDTNSCRDGSIELYSIRQKFSNVYMRRVDVAVQAASARVEKYAQTDLKYPKNMWTQSIADAMGSYIEDGGGGDQKKKKKKKEKDILDIEEGDDDDDDESSSDDESDNNLEDDLAIQTFKRAFIRMRRPSYKKMMNSFAKNWEDEYISVLELNAVMDMYCNDYHNLATKEKVDMYATMTFNEYICFTDVRAKDKYVSCAVFHPMWSGIVAICYADSSPNVMKSISTRPDPIRRAVYGLNPVMIWSHIDSLYPKLYLDCIREVKSLAFCPFNENILIGGCVNGQVVIWDLTNKLEKVETIEVLGETRERYRIAMNAHMGWMKPVQDNAVVPATAMSNLAVSHHGSINAIRWFSPNFNISNTGQITPIENGKHSFMFFTAADDGTILIWDMNITNVSFTESKKVKKSKRVPVRPAGLMVDFSPYKVLDRNLSPVFKLIVGIPASNEPPLHLQCLSMDGPKVEYTHVPKADGKGRKYFTNKILDQAEEDLSNVMYCGAQHGEFKVINWEGHSFNTGELINSEYCNIKYNCTIHDGIVYCVSKNPFLSNLVLSVGGKVFAVWHEHFQGRPLIWKKRPCRLTDGVWSLYKPSLFFIGTSDGNLETWDLLLKSDQPIAVQAVSGYMLTGVALHTLPLAKNLIAVSDQCGAFNMFINPPIFMIQNKSHVSRLESILDRELKVMKEFMAWQDQIMKNNAHIFQEMKRKEALLLLEKEEEKKKIREQEEQKREEEEEARRQARLRVIGPEERWQRIVQKLIEQTIAAKKRIDRDALIEAEKPLRELELQRLEKKRRMVEIMKNQKTIFSDTVAILFPEAVKKPPKPKKVYLPGDRDVLKNEYLEDYETIKSQACKTVCENPYKSFFSWEASLAEGKERREALSAELDLIFMHKRRIELPSGAYFPKKCVSVKQVEFDDDKAEKDEEREKSDEGEKSD